MKDRQFAMEVAILIFVSLDFILRIVEVFI